MPPIEVASDGYQAPRKGIIFLYCCVAFIFLLFVMRFWYLQMLKGKDFVRMADSNRTRSEQVYATRGIITDVKGKLLAENRPAYCLTITPEDCPDIGATLAQISMWTDVPIDFLHSRYKREMRSFEPQVLVLDIPFEKVANIEQQLYQWPGVDIVTRQRRYYPEEDNFAHILGYVSEASENEIDKDPDLSLGDIVGKQGIEVEFEKYLRGTKGKNRVEVDVLGRQLYTHREISPQAGENIVLSIDADLQDVAREALGEESGSVVVMEPDTGKIRALLTTPAYDNNLFTSRLSHDDWEQIRDDPRKPLQNRTIQSTFPPGSVWKLMMAGLFLEQGIKPNETIFCRGSVTLGNRVFRCWRTGGHGSVDMLRALVQSCDSYFYEMSLKVGIDNIERYAKACGFGHITGIDLPHERAGLVPGKEWKRARFKESWQRGETLNVSIGQGSTLVTPLQMAVFTSALLNGGKLMKPIVLESEAPVLKSEIPMPEKDRDFIVEAMRITAEEGTARRIKRRDAFMGGKTGTAQVVKLGERRKKKHEMAYHHRDHAWITTFGKKNDQTYVVVVMVEHGGGGGANAGPVAAKMFEALFGPEEKI